MSDADTRIDSLKEDIRGIGYTVLDLQAKAVAHDSKLEQVLATQLAHETRFDQIDARLGGLETRFGGLEAHVERRFASQDSRFDRIDALLAEVLSQLSQPPQ
jgi:chromosome segregation ATPase